MSRAVRNVAVVVLAATVALLTLLASPAAAGPSPDGIPAQIVQHERSAPPPAELAQVEAPTGPQAPKEPQVSVSVTSDDAALSRTVIIILMMTVGSVAPAILLMMTSFTRFAVVLSLTRQAVGVPSVPPTQVLLGLALMMTVFVMQPVFSQINDNALQPMLAGEIDQSEALEEAVGPMRTFMLSQTDRSDLGAMMKAVGREEPPETPDDTPMTALIPAFVLSELRAAFTIAVFVFIPFVVLDLVVASTLMSLGMVMLPPVFVSLPLKLLLFVLVDGWGLLVGSLLRSVANV